MLGLMSRGYLCATPAQTLLPISPAIVSATVWRPTVGGVQSEVLVPSGAGGVTLSPSVDGVATATAEAAPTGAGVELAPLIVAAQEE